MDNNIFPFCTNGCADAELSSEEILVLIDDVAGINDLKAFCNTTFPSI
jgi:hypothetical protein